MKECPICHKQNSSDSPQCTSCGLNLENVQDIKSDIIVEERKQPRKNNQTKIIFSIIIFVIIVILILLSFKINSFNEIATPDESINSNYEYDALQQLFLESDNFVTPEHLMEYAEPYIEKYNLYYNHREIPKYDNVIEYKFAYSEDVAELKYPERGDYIQFTFDKSEKYNYYFLSNVQYFNNTAYNSEDICIAEYDCGTYCGHYSYKYKENLNKKRHFQDKETLINEIINNANTVYITPFSKKYHYSINCAGKNATAVKLDQLDEGFKPCKECIE